MATVTELRDHVKRVASLGSYDGTDEEALIVDWLNDGYQYACRECDTPTETVTASLTSGDAEYSLSDLSLTNVVRFRRVYITGSSPDPFKLEEIDGDRLLELQTSDGGSQQDKPIYYSFDGLDLIQLWPTPGAGLTLAAKAIVDPPVLVVSGPSAGEETTPSKIPQSYHYSVLANHAIMMGLEYRGGDANVARAQYFMSMRDRGVASLQERRNQMGGDIPPPVRVIRGRMSHNVYPDQL